MTTPAKAALPVLSALRSKVEAMRTERGRPHAAPTRVVYARQQGELNMLDWVLREMDNMALPKDPWCGCSDPDYCRRTSGVKPPYRTEQENTDSP